LIVEQLGEARRKVCSPEWLDEPRQVGRDAFYFRIA
jgi:hypothetical protein